MKQKLLKLLLPAILFVAGINAQNIRFPLRNQNNSYSAGKDTSTIEALVYTWDTTLISVQKQVNASNQEFKAFVQNYQTYLDSERSAIYPQIKKGKLSSSNFQPYFNNKRQVLVALYNTFSNNKKNNRQTPKRLFPSYVAPTCDSACTNMNFLTGDFTGWYGYYEVNSSGFGNFNFTGINGGYLGAVNKACYDPNTSSYQMHVTTGGNDYLLQTYARISMPQVSPWGVGTSVMLGDSTGINSGMAILSQKFQVTALNNSVTYAYAILIENPASHSYYEQPFFSVTLFDSSGDTISNCGKYFVSSGPGLPGFKGIWYSPEADTVYWRDWTQVNVPLDKYIGQCVTIQFLVADCSLGGHFGYAYVDASCDKFSIKPSSPTGLICKNHGTITLSGPFGGSAYIWSGPGIVGSDTTQVITVDSAGKYVLILTPVTGDLCKDTIYYTVPGFDSLTATAAVKTPITCFGSPGTGIAKALNGYNPYQYQWSAPGGTNQIGTGLVAGNYTVTITDSNACTASATLTLTQPTQLITTIKVTPPLCGNTKRTLTASATGGVSPYTYLWSPVGGTTATATGLSTGTYTITVTDNIGCASTASVSVTAPTQLIVNINPTYPQCSGATGSAAAVVGGGTIPYTYLWNPTGQTTPTATGLTVGSYVVNVTDNNGCTASASVSITQPAPFKTTITITYPACNGDKGSATVTASGGTPAYKYLWTPSGQTNAAATGLPAATYTVLVTDSRGCTATASVNMTQPAALAVVMSFTHASCGLPNGTATASVTGGSVPYVYAWSPGGQTNATAGGLLAGTYTVKVTDYHNCTISASVTVTQPSAVQVSIVSKTNVTCNGTPTGSATASGSGGTAPYGYQWSPGGGNGITGTGLVAGKYVVTIRDANGCTATAGTIVTQPAALVVTVTGPQIRCLGDSGTFTANVTGGTSPYIYKWSGGNGIGNTSSSVTSLRPPASITYTVQVTDANGCVSNAYMNFNFPPPLAVSISGASVTCSKRTATLCGLATGGTGGDTYLWEPINLTSPCMTIPASFTTVYTLTVEDNCGVTATADATVDVQPPPAVSFVSNSTQGCSPLCIQFVNLTPPTGGKELYEWNFGNGDSLQSENPIYCYKRGGIYSVTLTVISDSGCSSSLRKIGLISVYSPPRAAFTYSPQPVTILAPTVQFQDESIDSNGLAYRWWSFGDGSDSVTHIANPMHTYHDTGTYCIQLIDMNAKGCSDTVTNCLIIEPQYSLYIPSAFTPNRDGLNDVFKPIGEYIRYFDMYIFDRWGMEIYHTNDINKGWDGTIHGVGTVSQEDTYIYKITITDAQYNQHSYIGNVTLLK